MNTKKKILILTGVFVLLILMRILVASLTFNSRGAFIGYLYYLRLFTHEKIFLRALFNTIIPYLFAALICVIVLGLVRHLRLKKSKTAFLDRRYFLCVFIILYLINRLVALFMSTILLVYDGVGSVIPIARYLLNTIFVIFFSPKGILDSAIYALFFCFILWIIDALQRRNVLEPKTNN